MKRLSGFRICNDLMDKGLRNLKQLIHALGRPSRAKWLKGREVSTDCIYVSLEAIGGNHHAFIDSRHVAQSHRERSTDERLTSPLKGIWRRCYGARKQEQTWEDRNSL